MGVAGNNEGGSRVTLSGATKTFDSLVAVDGLSLTLEPGRLHALIGENGAGKSTALKMLAGIYEPTDGQVLVDGEPLVPVTAQEAFARGIGMVHQHFMLVEAFSALENLVLGSEPCRDGPQGKLGQIDFAQARKRAADVAGRAGLHLDLERPTSELSVGEKQRLEILRVLYRGARVLLLDEPTAVLSPVETIELYRTLRRLASEGATIAVVTHRLDEVLRYCDYVTVMRRGLGVLERPLPGADADIDQHSTENLRAELTHAIMGGEPPAAATPPNRDDTAKVILELKEVGTTNSDGRPTLTAVSLTLRAGEILGVAGVEGNGQSEIVRALAGLTPLATGRIDLEGQVLFDSTPGAAASSDRSAAVRSARSRGLMAVHEDRHRDEMLGAASVADNLMLGDLDTVDEPAAIERRFERFKVYPPDAQRRGDELSGGNQQKVVMARALDRPLKALVLAQPTRGVDIGTARTIHHAIAKAASDGAAVLLLSADLNELRCLSHRLVVLHRGQIAAHLDPTASDEAIGRAMLGGDQNENENENDEAGS